MILDEQDKQRVIRERRYATFMHEYDAAHSHCPKCGSTRYWTTLMGCIPDWNHPELYKDTNKCECQDCKWLGYRHDMV